ncbi:hypothetical protein [Rubrivirga sp.]|uniref:hypothetical protein n=1 Tax=Rubrivirga sp. TaxID=1885344 RepID=UPI003C764C32
MSRALLTVSVLLVALGGCVSLETGRVGHEIARDLERDSSVDVVRGLSVSAGRGLIGTGRFFARMFAPKSTEDGRRLARHVRVAQVSLYSIRGVTDLSYLSPPSALDDYREEDGWYRLATIRDTSGTAWVLYREDGDALRDLLAVVVSTDDLVVTKLSGDLTELVLEAADTWSPSSLIDEVLFKEPEPDEVVAEGSTGRNASGETPM